MLILVINAGSSSAKYRLFNIKTGNSVTKGVIERIGEKGSSCKNHHEAIGLIRQRLLSGKDAPVKSIKEIRGIGHRVVHGGEHFSKAVIINKKVIEAIKKASALAPLHNPPALEGIKACRKHFAGMPEVAVFDTAFHQSMPPFAYIYGIPFGFYKRYRIRRYGFHGTSHRYVAGEAAKKLGKPLAKSKLVTIHLGNGCSMAAVKNGESVDTTMGLTPLEGLLMGTRSGDLDPAIVTFLMNKEGMTPEKMDTLLNKKSGFLGVSGVSNDMRDIMKAVRRGNKRAKLAFDIFVYRIKKYTGAYAAAMGGLDAAVFTGGIGENVPGLRDRVARGLKKLLGSRTKFFIIPTNEELLIARDTHRLTRTKNSV